MATENPITSNMPIPPGEYLEEVLEELGMSKGELAKRMGRPQAKLSAVLKGTKAVTPDTALQLERVTNVPAHIWIGLEAEYRLAQARQRAEERELACRSEAHLVTRFCYKELRAMGLVPDHHRAVDKVKALQEFLGVMSLASVCELPRSGVAYRHGVATKSGRSPEAVAAWLRVGEVTGQKAECAPFNEDRLTAVLMITLRYKWADIFRFTLFHELGHIMLHGNKSIILEGSEKGDQEKEADCFARDMLIPPTQWNRFADGAEFTDRDISTFARKTGIASGIVVGRLQHEQRIAANRGNRLRVRYTLERGE